MIVAGKALVGVVEAAYTVAEEGTKVAILEARTEVDPAGGVGSTAGADSWRMGDEEATVAERDGDKYDTLAAAVNEDAGIEVARE